MSILFKYTICLIFPLTWRFAWNKLILQHQQIITDKNITFCYNNAFQMDCAFIFILIEYNPIEFTWQKMFWRLEAYDITFADFNHVLLYMI